MTKLDAGLMTSLPASDSGSAAFCGSKRINPQPQSCLCLTCSGYLSNDDDDDELIFISFNSLFHLLGSSEVNQKSEKQIQKRKINKALKSWQKNFKTTEKYSND